MKMHKTKDFLFISSDNFVHFALSGRISDTTYLPAKTIKISQKEHFVWAGKKIMKSKLEYVKKNNKYANVSSHYSRNGFLYLLKFNFFFFCFFTLKQHNGFPCSTVVFKYRLLALNIQIKMNGFLLTWFSSSLIKELINFFFVFFSSEKVIFDSFIN